MEQVLIWLLGIALGYYLGELKLKAYRDKVRGYVKDLKEEVLKKRSSGMTDHLKKIWQSGYDCAESRSAYMSDPDWSKEEYEAYREGFVSGCEKQNKKTEEAKCHRK